MKILKYILITIACLIIIGCLLGLILPKDYTVSRSAAIHAPAPIVLAHIKSLQMMDRWSVWSKRDPNIKQEFGGKDGDVGSWSSWEGNKDVGKGKQEITAITNNSVDMKLTFVEPWATQSDVNFSLADTTGGTKVTWSMQGKMPFPFNVFGAFMNMDKMIGNDFEAGLAGLKTMSEEAAAHPPMPQYEIKEINFEPKQYVTKRATVKFAEVGAFFGKTIPEVFAATGKAGLQPVGPPCTIYYKWNTEKQETDMAVAVPVSAQAKIPAIKGMEPAKAEGRALELVYMGNYDKMPAAYAALDNYIKEKNLQHNDMAIEEYLTDPKSEKDTAKWLTNIYYFVK